MITPEEKAALVSKWKDVIDFVGPANIFDTHAELAWLCETASAIPGNGHYLEIGSYFGASMKSVAIANPSLMLTSLDTWDDANSFQAFIDLMHREQRDLRLGYYRGPSRDGLQWIKSWHAGPWFDFAFVDGGHLYQDLKEDITGVLPLMKPGAILAGHDYREGLASDGVTRAVNELLTGFVVACDSIWAIKLP